MELIEQEEPRQRHGKVNEAFISEVSQTFDLSDRCAVVYFLNYTVVIEIAKC